MSVGHSHLHVNSNDQEFQKISIHVTVNRRRSIYYILIYIALADKLTSELSSELIASENGSHYLKLKLCNLKLHS